MTASGHDDPFNLQRFLDAQERVIVSVIAELRQGRKRGHWIWFVFPQLRGLGHSANSEFYGVSGIAEATAYLQHPVLGKRLVECAGLVNAAPRRTAEDIFGEIDAMKFRSSMTLFAKAAPGERAFVEALEKYFDGEPDPLTAKLLTGSQ